MKNHRHTTSPLQVWEGHFSGKHWVARVVDIDETEGICALSVVTGNRRDEAPTRANCHWDAQCDHFLNRYCSATSVPPGITYEMRDGLRRWFSTRSRAAARH